jgi:hypothetical protein
MTQQIALVSETTEISAKELTRVAAALNVQLARDFAPVWSVDAAVTTVRHRGAWPLVVTQDAPAAGVHVDDHGRPTALVDYADDWALAASHELLEMCADPYGSRVVTARSVKPGQGRVEYLVEVCDPCEACSYDIDGVAVSDFYTPRFFDPAPRAGVRYSHTGAITRPRQVLRGGYLSWRVPSTGEWWQQLWVDGPRPTFRNLGVLEQLGQTCETGAAPRPAPIEQSHGMPTVGGRSRRNGTARLA